jgi:hypothetical protein
MRDGNDLVGWGMATGIWEALQMPTAARIVLTGNGHAIWHTCRGASTIAHIARDALD